MPTQGRSAPLLSSLAVLSVCDRALDLKDVYREAVAPESRDRDFRLLEEVCTVMMFLKLSESITAASALLPKIPIQLAEYRQRKAHADSQKKQKKKKKKKSAEDSEGEPRGQAEVERDRPAGGEEGLGDARDGAREGGQEEPPTTQFTFSRTLRTGETVQHDQTYTIEVETQPLTRTRTTCSQPSNPVRVDQPIVVLDVLLNFLLVPSLPRRCLSSDGPLGRRGLIQGLSLTALLPLMQRRPTKKTPKNSWVKKYRLLWKQTIAFEQVEMCRSS